MYSYHDSQYKYSSWQFLIDDSIGLVSKSGFEGTGLVNGINHLKCWVKSPDEGSFLNSEFYNHDWYPDFDTS